MFSKVAFALCGCLLVSASARAQDAIDLSQATVYNSPPDIASWPITTAITRLEMQPTAGAAPGVSLTFSAQNTWPDYTPPGWDGPLQYTVWAVFNINGHWVTSGFIQMWSGRGNTGAPLLTDFAINWAYDSRWGPMNGYQPHVGEQVGFFVSAGDARGNRGVTSVRERSNVVVVNLPANDTGVFTFAPRAMTRTILTGDFTGDGRPDLVAQNVDGLVTLAQGAGTQFNVIQSPYNGVTSAWYIAGVGDFNGDGRPDLVWQGPTGAVVVWLNNGASQPSTQYLYAGSSSWRVVGVTDIDRDGSADLLWQSPSGQVVVWLMHGTTVSQSMYVWSSASVWRVVGTGDFNGDGYADLLWQGPSGSLVVWMMRGTTQVSAQSIFAGASAWVALSVGDVNGDGSPDIVWASPTGQIAAWLMNGATLSQSKYINQSGSTWLISDTP